MVGLSMAATIGVCIGAFIFIYGQVDPLARDFVDAATAAPTRPPTEEAASSGGGRRTPTPVADDENDEDEPSIEEADPTEEPDGFNPTHRIISDLPINLRPGPAVSSGAPRAQLDPGTELQYLGETRRSEDPNADGDLNWLQFRTEDGLEGWIREIDVEPLNAGQ